MTEDEREKHCYLGDAVYAEWDGSYFILRTDSHLDNECGNKIFLDIDVLKSLIEFIEFIEKMIKKKS